MPFNENLPAENTDPWYAPMVSAWNALKAFVNGLETTLGTKASSAALTSGLASKADLVGGVVPSSQIPAIAITEFLGTVASEAAMLALVGQKGDWAIRSDTSTTWIITGNTPSSISSWTQIETPSGGGGAVNSVNGQTGTVVLGASDVSAATAAQGAKADSAVQPADLSAGLAGKADLVDGLVPLAQVPDVQGPRGEQGPVGPPGGTPALVESVLTSADPTVVLAVNEHHIVTMDADVEYLYLALPEAPANLSRTLVTLLASGVTAVLVQAYNPSLDGQPWVVTPPVMRYSGTGFTTGIFQEFPVVSDDGVIPAATTIEFTYIAGAQPHWIANFLAGTSYQPRPAA